MLGKIRAEKGGGPVLDYYIFVGIQERERIEKRAPFH